MRSKERPKFLWCLLIAAVVTALGSACAPLPATERSSATVAEPTVAADAAPTSVLPQPPADAGQSPQRYGYRIVDTLPHDVAAFTQGLLYHDDLFYESTGLRGQSTLRKVEPSTGDVIAGLALPAEYFAEGLTLLNDRLYQLTWQGETAFVYDLESLDLLDQLSYPTEGWGLTNNGRELILSDGTATVYFLDPATFETVRTIDVRDQGAPVDMINELEYIDGWIFGNIWMTDEVAIIDPADGEVRGWIDFSGLLSDEQRAAMVDELVARGAGESWVESGAVLNGIAYDAADNRLFVTGKLWPHIFEVQLTADE